LHGYAERQGRQFQSYRFSLPSALLAEDKRMFCISARKRFFAAANKMCCIAARKSSELLGIATTEAGRPAVRSLAFAQLCRSGYQEDRDYIRVIHANPADARTAGAEWDKADGRSVPICCVDTDMPVSWE
jgi:hypothetical protein